MTVRTLRATGKVLPGQGRAQHRSMILQHLFHAGPCSRADLARATGLTRVTVSNLVADLLAEALVAELGQQPRPDNKVGKPATLVGLRTDSFQIVGIDLLDVAVHGAVLDLTGAVVERRTFPDHATGDDGVRALLAICAELLALATRPVLGIGITSPGVIDETGTVLQAPNRGWYDVPLAQILTAELDVPTHVANDANAAALGEFTFGGATGSGLLTVSVGDGVGAGLILDGALLLGQGAVGEIGHVTAVDDDSPDATLGGPQRCACGRLGCLETILSVPALRRRIEALDASAAHAALAAVGRRLGLVLAPVVGLLDVTEIVLSGPADLLDGPLLDTALSTIRERTLPHVSRDLQMRMTTLGEDGALAGAAVLVLSGRLGVS